MKVDNYKNLLEEFNKDIKFDHELKKKTWFYPKNYTYEVMQHVLFD